MRITLISIPIVGLVVVLVLDGQGAWLRMGPMRPMGLVGRISLVRPIGPIRSHPKSISLPDPKEA
jgi:hypothetical protein